ncbi:MAG: hypothetical protein M1820_006823 [Bogoriella megaspora]|nr:MAG: hypothetical protein M1820_006823 [Bogoriella megaspora]
MDLYLDACKTGDLQFVQNFVPDYFSRNWNGSASTTGLPSHLEQSLAIGLRAAIEHDHPRIVDYLYEQDLPVSQSEVWLAIESKASNEMFEVLFCDGGWDINEIRAATLPPFLAVVVEDERLVRQFLHLGADPNKSCKLGTNGFMAAAERGSLSTVQAMHTAGGNPFPTVPSAAKGQGPESERLQILKYLLDNGASINAFDLQHCQYGFDSILCPLTGLHYAANYGKTEMVELLLQRGANANVRDELGRSPGDLASANGHYLVVKLLSVAPSGPELKVNIGETEERPEYFPSGVVCRKWRIRFLSQSS